MIKMLRYYKVKFMILLIAFAAFFILLLIYMHIETRLLSGSFLILSRGKKAVVRKMKSYTEPVFRTIPDKAAIKFMHLTDFHVRRLYIPPEKILKAIETHKPDIMLLTGDYFQSEHEIEKFFSIMRKIRAVFQGEIFLCFGNHDRKDVFDRVEGSFIRVLEGLKKLRVTVLENQSALYRKNGMDLNIIGLSDARTNNENVEKIIAETALASCPNLVITHNCDILLKMKAGSSDFVLSGHTHGAQIWSPFNIEIKLLHRRDQLSQQNIFRGLHRYKDIDLYINRGLGNTCLPIRLFSRPEILLGIVVYE